eukprot:GHUV01027729.1.p1 GENE.GHUV01027729.1~~GHUV01027729.1.p1  ORF type:complete len:128 (-),score=9.55 GHUV01027729.1:423-806(-)
MTGISAVCPPSTPQSLTRHSLFMSEPRADLHYLLLQVKRLVLCDRCGTRMPSVRATMDQKIGKVYRGLDLTLECYPADDVQDDPDAAIKVLNYHILCYTYCGLVWCEMLGWWFQVLLTCDAAAAIGI